MEDDGKVQKPNEVVITGQQGSVGLGTSGGRVEGEYFIIENADPSQMIERVFIHGEDYKVVDNIPIEKAREIFEQQVNKTEDSVIISIKEKVTRKMTINHRKKKSNI